MVSNSPSVIWTLMEMRSSISSWPSELDSCFSQPPGDFYAHSNLRILQTFPGNWNPESALWRLLTVFSDCKAEGAGKERNPWDVKNGSMFRGFPDSVWILAFISFTGLYLSVSSLAILLSPIILLYYIKSVWPLSPAPGRKTKSMSHTWVYITKITHNRVWSQKKGWEQG